MTTSNPLDAITRTTNTGARRMNNKQILDNAPEGATHEVTMVFIIFELSSGYEILVVKNGLKVEVYTTYVDHYPK